MVDIYDEIDNPTIISKSTKHKVNNMARRIGVDIGTGNIAACWSAKGSADKKLDRIKDAFFRIDSAGNNFTESMLQQANARYSVIDGSIYVLGDQAFTLANLFHAEAQRPMAKGVLNPTNPMAAVILKELIHGLIGDGGEGDVLYYSIPADPVDADYNNIFHTDVLKGIFKQLGYPNAKPLNEGLAVVYSTFPKSLSLPSLGISLGAGCVNVCYSFLGLPVFTFSISKSGDFIDENVAIATNDTKSACAFVKESGKVDLTNPTNNVEAAIAIYYNALLGLIAKEFKKIYETKPKKDLPSISAPVKVAVAGGTSLAKGFIPKLEAHLKADGFPIPIGEITHADDPLMAIADGVWFAAANDKN
jgi:hypothetical protein